MRDKTLTSFETLCVHAGVRPDPTVGAVMTPIFQTSTYAQEEPRKAEDLGLCSRWKPHSICPGRIFGGPRGSGACLRLVFRSGCDPGGSSTDRAGFPRLGFGRRLWRNGRLFRELFARYGIQFEFVDFRNTAEVSSKVKPNTRLIWLESPTNPLLRLADIAALSTLAREKGILLAVDNTFASPVFQSPLTLGADIVMHSTTKYIGGHSDLIGGALMLNNAALAERLRFIQYAAGSISSPFECFLILRSIKTLAVRMKKHQENAIAVAKALQEIPEFSEVIFPGLESHPQHALAKKQMKGFSGVIGVRIHGGQESASRFLKNLKIFTLAESFGGVESLANHPLTMTHASVPEQLRKHLGITEDLIRLSVGIEDSENLIADIYQALGSK